MAGNHFPPARILSKVGPGKHALLRIAQLMRFLHGGLTPRRSPARREILA
jgi:hypothetical protein